MEDYAIIGNINLSINLTNGILASMIIRVVAFYYSSQISTNGHVFINFFRLF